MTSKLKCPVCNVLLTECGDLLFCPNDHCGWVGNAALWQALIQAKKDLEIARTALREIRYCKSAGFDLPAQTPWEIIADKALEQISHKE